MVDKDALFDELSKKFPPGKYATLCNKMGVGYDEAKNILKTCQQDYNEALRVALSQWNQRMKGVTRKQIEDALDGAEVGGLCSIVRKHYEKASTEVVAATGVIAGDGALHDTRNQGGSPSTTAASTKVNDVEEAPTLRQRGVDPTSNIQVVQRTETNDGNRSMTTITWTGISKEATIILFIVLGFGVVLFILNRILG